MKRHDKVSPIVIACRWAFFPVLFLAWTVVGSNTWLVDFLFYVLVAMAAIMLMFGTYTGHGRRRYRTSRMVIYLRTVIPFCILGYLMGLTSGKYDDEVRWVLVWLTGGIWPTFGVAMLVRITGHLLFGNRPDYQLYIERGGDPFWDCMFWPLNRDSQTVAAGGLPEPEYPNGQQPPEDWNFQCGICGARKPQGERCWNCGSGRQDGQATRISGSVVQCDCGQQILDNNCGLETGGICCPKCHKWVTPGPHRPNWIVDPPEGGPGRLPIS